MLRYVLMAAVVPSALSQGDFEARMFNDGAGAEVPEPYDPIGSYQRLKEPIFNEVPGVLRLPSQTSRLGLAPSLPSSMASTYPRPSAATNRLLFPSSASSPVQLRSQQLRVQQPSTQLLVQRASAQSRSSLAGARTQHQLRPQPQLSLLSQPHFSVPRMGMGRGFWGGYPGLRYGYPGVPQAPPPAPVVPSSLPSQPSKDMKPSQATKDAYDAALEAYNTYQKALIEAQSAKAIEKLEGKGSATALKSAGTCGYHFECETGHLCLSGQCMPVGGTHKGQSCGSRFSSDCPDDEACYQFTCFPTTV